MGLAAAGWVLERGMLWSGPGAPALPDDSGLKIGGTFASVRLEDWMSDVGPGGTESRLYPTNLLTQINIEADKAAVFGQVFQR